jgi:hypothetical protein
LTSHQRDDAFTEKDRVSFMLTISNDGSETARDCVIEYYITDIYEQITGHIKNRRTGLDKVFDMPGHSQRSEIVEVPGKYPYKDLVLSLSCENATSPAYKIAGYYWNRLGTHVDFRSRPLALGPQKIPDLHFQRLPLFDRRLDTSKNH